MSDTFTYEFILAVEPEVVQFFIEDWEVYKLRATITQAKLDETEEKWRGVTNAICVKYRIDGNDPAWSLWYYWRIKTGREDEI